MEVSHQMTFNAVLKFFPSNSCKSGVVNLLSGFLVGFLRKLGSNFWTPQSSPLFDEGYISALFEVSVRCPLNWVHAVAESTRGVVTQSCRTDVTRMPNIAYIMPPSLSTNQI